MCRGLCRRCAVKQLEANRAAVERRAHDRVARVVVQRDAVRAQNAASDPGYREACAAMRDDVVVATEAWSMGLRWG